MSDDDLDEDPGWRLSPRMLLYMVPGYLGYETRRGGNARHDGLETIRQVFLTFSFTIVLFGLVLVAVVHGEEKAPAGPWIIGVAIASALSLGAEEVVGRRRLDCADPITLGTTYRAHFFTRIAIAMSIALLAFVGAMTVSEWWLYWMFLPFALGGLARAAPTRGHLASDQDQLYADGCHLSLVRALRQLRSTSN